MRVWPESTWAASQRRPVSEGRLQADRCAYGLGRAKKAVNTTWNGLEQLTQVKNSECANLREDASARQGAWNLEDGSQESYGVSVFAGFCRFSVEGSGVSDFGLEVAASRDCCASIYCQDCYDCKELVLESDAMLDESIDSAGFSLQGS